MGQDMRAHERRNYVTDADFLLATPMHPRCNEAGAETVGGYLAALGAALITEAEGFSGKKPFGNSGWEWDIPIALVLAGVIPGEVTFDDDGYLDDGPSRESIRAADEAVKAALAEALGR